jgi:hypothetical protein
MSTVDDFIIATPVASLASLATLRAALASLDLSACLPIPPDGSLRPALPWEELSERTLHVRRTIYVLMTFVAYGDRRRAQKKRANGWAPALRRPPAVADLPLYSMREALHLYNQRTHHQELADELDLLVRLAARTRNALLKQREDAPQWQAALEQQVVRVWSLLEQLAPYWARHAYPGKEQEAWHGCWRRLFGTTPPERLLPLDPPVEPRPALPPSLIERLGLLNV